MASSSEPYNDYALLRNAIRENDMETARCLLLKNAPVNPDNHLRYRTNTPLHWAIRRRADIEFIKILVNKGANIYAISRNYQTPLQMAAQYGRQDVVQLLKNRETLLSNSSKNFRSIYSAVENKQLTIVKKIREFRVDVDEINLQTGLTLLHVACINQDEDMAQLLINYNANLNIEAIESYIDTLNSRANPPKSEFFGKTPLFISIYNSDIKIMNLLLRNGADVNFIHHSGQTPLYCSIKNSFNFRGYNQERRIYWRFCLNDDKDKKEIVELLLKNGANPNLMVGKVSELQLAIAEGYSNIVKLLLIYNANINYSDRFGNTPLHFAVRGDSTILDLILKRIPDINVGNNNRVTPLHIAATKINCTALEKLLKNNANVNSVDKNGDTALHIACRNGNSLEAVQILLKYNADINIKNRYKETPFQSIISCTSRVHSKNTTQTLKEYRSDIHPITGNWNVVLNNSINDRDAIRIEIIEILLDHGADIDSVDYMGKTLLTNACQCGHKNIVKILLKHGAEMDYQDVYGRTTLHYTAFEFKPYMFELLLRHGADINILCNRKNTILHSIRPGTKNGQDIPTTVEKFEIVEKHIIKLQCAKLHVLKEHLTYLQTIILFVINNNNDNTYRHNVLYQQFQDRCNEEIKHLKTVKIGYITLYNLLHYDIHDICKFVRNDDIIQTLHSEDFEKTFSLYGTFIKSRFCRAAKRRKLLEIAQKYSTCSIFNRFPTNCMDKIFYYLELKDLKVFINVIQKSSTISK